MRCSLLIVLCVCLATQSLVKGEAIRQPPSLEAGERYRLAYVTSSTTTALSSDIEFYNNFVQESANAAPLGEWGLEWNAIAATETVTARENTATDPENDESMPVFLVNGTELAPSYGRFWDAEFDLLGTSFDSNEFGERFSFDGSHLLVWTGTGSNGLPFTFAGPPKFGALGANGYAISGIGDLASDSWFNFTARRNTSELHLYAISEPLTAVPEPCNSLHAFVLLSVLMRRRKRDVNKRCQESKEKLR